MDDTAAIAAGLAARVRESTTPHPPELAADIARVHGRLVHQRLFGTAATCALGTLVVAAALTFQPLLIGLSYMAGLGGLSVLGRASRKKQDVLELSSGARFADARAVAPSWHCANCAMALGRFEHENALGRPYFLLEIPDDQRLTIVRVRRRWSRTFFGSDRVPVLYAPGSETVLCFEPLGGGPFLGHVLTRPMPRATLARHRLPPGCSQLKWE